MFNLSCGIHVEKNEANGWTGWTGHSLSKANTLIVNGFFNLSELNDEIMWLKKNGMEIKETTEPLKEKSGHVTVFLNNTESQE